MIIELSKKAFDQKSFLIESLSWSINNDDPDFPYLRTGFLNSDPNGKTKSDVWPFFLEIGLPSEIDEVIFGLNEFRKDQKERADPKKCIHPWDDMIPQNCNKGQYICTRCKTILSK